eukprot:6515417-Karenia_brevis.AAC.1
METALLHKEAKAGGVAGPKQHIFMMMEKGHGLNMWMKCVHKLQNHNVRWEQVDRIGICHHQPRMRDL